MPIRGIDFDNYWIELMPYNNYSKENVLTVVVGKNGLGKSRLLRAICDYLYSNIEYYHAYEASSPKLIAISTSPFDKFHKNNKNKINYKYIGLKNSGMFNSSFSLSLISNAALSLLNRLNSDYKSEIFLDVFGVLGFYPIAEYVLKPVFGVSPINSVSSDNELMKFSASEGNFRFFIDSRYKYVFSELDTSDKDLLAYSMENVYELFLSSKTYRLNIEFHQGSVNLDGKKLPPHLIQSITNLMEKGLLRLTDLRLEKINEGRISLKAASSGEQCLLSIIFGIAGFIENDSVILIDEPEISLHPEWQEQFFPLLEKSFFNFSNCQFLIATHSPQIVSKITSNNSYVYSMQHKKLFSSEGFKSKSSDYILAKLFEAPGSMNEYVSRKSFDLIAKIRYFKSINSEIKNDLDGLRSLMPHISKDDPLIKIFNSIKELVFVYDKN